MSEQRDRLKSVARRLALLAKRTSTKLEGAESGTVMCIPLHGFAVGQPHRIDDRGSQVLKALRRIGFEQYYMAEQEGWVLYLEGSTDLARLADLKSAAITDLWGTALRWKMVAHYR